MNLHRMMGSFFSRPAQFWVSAGSVVKQRLKPVNPSGLPAQLRQQTEAFGDEPGKLAEHLAAEEPDISPRSSKIELKERILFSISGHKHTWVCWMCLFKR